MQNAGVKRVVRLRRRRARDREHAFLIEGYRELLRAVEAMTPLESVYYCPAFYLGSNEPALLSRAGRSCGAVLIETDEVVFDRISYRDRPDGLLAVASIPTWTIDSLPEPPMDPLYVVATAIEKPGNLGTLLRTADAVGAAAEDHDFSFVRLGELVLIAVGRVIIRSLGGELGRAGVD